MDDVAEPRSALEARGAAVDLAQLEALPRSHNLLWRVVAKGGREFVLRQLPEFPPGVGPVEEFRVAFATCRLQASLSRRRSSPTTVVSAHRSATGSARCCPSSAATPAIMKSGPAQQGVPDRAGRSMRRFRTRSGRVSFVDDPARNTLREEPSKLPERPGNHLLRLSTNSGATVTDLPAQRTHGDCKTGDGAHPWAGKCPY